MTDESIVFEPTIDFSCLPNSVLLEKSQVELVDEEGNKVSAQGEAFFEVTPSLGIYFYCAYELESMFSDVISIKYKDNVINGFSIKTSFNSEGNRKVKWCPRKEPITALGNEKTRLNYIIAHLFDFPKYLGSRHSVEEKGDKRFAVYHLDLLYEEWSIEVKGLVCGDSHEHQLTHIIHIKKKVGSLFSVQEGRGVIDALQTFFSFAKGSRSKVLCPSGFNQKREKVWQEWSSPSRMELANSWFDEGNAEQLNTLFPLFMKLWHDKGWREAFGEINYWYTSASISSRGIDAGIILTQAAIERLSYEYVVKDKKLLSAKGFRDLRASDKYRLLFSSLNIPTEISEDTPEIKKVADKYRWEDLPHALTKIRNALIHPESKNRNDFKTVYFEAWKVGLWCLELGMLAVCEYQGTYSNRLTAEYIGEVENVPWANRGGSVFDVLHRGNHCG